ncbi:MAG TPA: hypothetical protein VI895_08025 [Bdellovibrionota bacterium]|nr:hypothetical protein [Bdellovibrionota bacterium]
MNRSSVFCFVTMLAWPTFLLAERVYHPEKVEVDVAMNNGRYRVVFETDLERIEQSTRWMTRFDFDTYDWTSLFGRLAGRAMNEIKLSLIEGVTEQLADIADDNRFDQDQTAGLAAAFVSTLAKNAKPRPPGDNHFYQPYELLMVGPASIKEQILLLGALLSSLCFDIEYVALEKKWSLSVLGTNLAQPGTVNLPESGLYRIGDQVFLLVRSGSADHQCKSATAPCTARVIEVDEICSREPRYRRPLRRAPDLNLLPSRIAYAMAASERYANHQSYNRGWDMDVGIAVSSIGKWGPPARASVGLSSGRTRTSQRLLFGNTREHFAPRDIQPLRR